MEENMMEFLAGFAGTPASDWATALCFAAIPVAFVAGWCFEAWRTRNWTDRDWQKKVEKR
jgi:hypothetical protein